MNAALEFTLELIRGVWRFRWTAMLVAWIVCLVGWLIVLAMPDTYSAWARVYVDTRTRLSQVTQGIGVESNIASEAEGVREALLGGPQLEKVARLSMPGYASASSGQQAAIISGLRTRLQVEATGERNRPADLYMITYTDQDRQTARRVVSQLLKLFLANSLGGSQEGSERAQQFLTQQMMPQPGVDPAQQKMTKFMPLLFGFMFYNFASGLVLYYLTSNLVSMGQQYFFNHTEAANAAARSVALPKKAGRK